MTYTLRIRKQASTDEPTFETYENEEAAIRAAYEWHLRGYSAVLVTV